MATGLFVIYPKAPNPILPYLLNPKPYILNPKRVLCQARESVFRRGPEILEKWQQLQADGADTDKKGRKGQELRVSTEVETFKLDFKEEGTEMARDLSHSTKNSRLKTWTSWTML